MTITENEFPKRIEVLPRVAAYARVTFGKDAMLHSLSSQVSYYSSIMTPNRIEFAYRSPLYLDKKAHFV